MREAIVTIYNPEQDGEPAHTVVLRVAFEGNAVTSTLDFRLENVVAVEHLMGKV